MKVIVLKKDDAVVITYPTEDYQTDEMILNCKIPKAFADYEKIIMEDTDIPEVMIEQLYFEGKDLKADTSWEKKLMPDFLIRKKRLEDIETELDSEVDLETPDVVKITKLAREKEKLLAKKLEPGNTDVEILQLAQADLAKSGKSKPTIENTLMEKIQELCK